jgi:hypothetical protein
MFERMQYIIGFPERIERHKSQHMIMDFDGNLIGNIIIQKYKSYGLLPLMEMRFFDVRGICQGILRQRKPGFVVIESPPLDILGPQEDVRGRIELAGGFHSKDSHTTHYGPHFLFDTLGHQIASTDPFEINDGVTNFEHLKMHGQDFKGPDDRNVAGIKGSPSGCQIDLYPPIGDPFLVLCFTVHSFF